MSDQYWNSLVYRMSGLNLHWLSLNVRQSIYMLWKSQGFCFFQKLLVVWNLNKESVVDDDDYDDDDDDDDDDSLVLS